MSNTTITIEQIPGSEPTAEVVAASDEQWVVMLVDRARSEGLRLTGEGADPRPRLAVRWTGTGGVDHAPLALPRPRTMSESLTHLAAITPRLGGSSAAGTVPRHGTTSLPTTSREPPDADAHPGGSVSVRPWAPHCPVSEPPPRALSHGWNRHRPSEITSTLPSLTRTAVSSSMK